VPAVGVRGGLWLEPNADRPDGYKSLAPIRQLIQAGSYEEASKAMTLSGGWAGAGTYVSYQPPGDLDLVMGREE
jgi:hypothetical protein